ncbi:MAG: efflux RND transporter periplasmic adaptor subunit [Saccharospirillum sp.]
MAKHIPSGPIIAVSLVVAIGAWLYSGVSNSDTAEAPEASAPDTATKTPVQYRTIRAEAVDNALQLNGVTHPARNVAISSEGTGRIVELLKQQGDAVEAGEVIARIDTQDLAAQLRQARAYQEQTRLEYEGSQRLGSEGLQNRAQLAASLTAYEQARAQLAQLERTLANTNIRAPFSGIIEQMDVEIGSFVRPGDPVAELYNFNPMKIVAHAPEADVGKLAVGQTATAHLLTGETMPADVTFIGSVADPATRTFRVELSVNEPARRVAGATATAQVQLGQTQAHYISPALLNINGAGEMGVKTLTDDDRVAFTPVSIVRSDTGGVWVSGLAEQTRLIVVGQGFVNPGEQVSPVVTRLNQSTNQ